MRSRTFILFPGSDAWRVAIAGDPATTGVEMFDIAGWQGYTPAPTAAAPAEALRANGHRAGEGVVLAVPSAWCLCAAVDSAGLPSRGRPQALAYRPEEKLPVS